MKITNLVRIPLPETKFKNPGNEKQRIILNITNKNNKEAYISQDIFVPNANEQLKQDLNNSGIYYDVIKPKKGIVSFKGE